MHILDKDNETANDAEGKGSENSLSENEEVNEEMGDGFSNVHDARNCKFECTIQQHALKKLEIGDIARVYDSILGRVLVRV